MQFAISPRLPMRESATELLLEHGLDGFGQRGNGAFNSDGGAVLRNCFYCMQHAPRHSVRMLDYRLPMDQIPATTALPLQRRHMNCFKIVGPK